MKSRRNLTSAFLLAVCTSVPAIAEPVWNVEQNYGNGAGQVPFTSANSAFFGSGSRLLGEVLSDGKATLTLAQGSNLYYAGQAANLGIPNGDVTFEWTAQTHNNSGMGLFISQTNSTGSSTWHTLPMLNGRNTGSLGSIPDFVGDGNKLPDSNHAPLGFDGTALHTMRVVRDNGVMSLYLDNDPTAVTTLQNGAIGAAPDAVNYFFAFLQDSNQPVTVDMHSFKVAYAAYVPEGPGPVDAAWAVDASGDWNVGFNWGGSKPNAVDAKANFNGINTSSRTVFSESAITVGTLRFNSPNTYQISGNGSLSIDVSADSGLIEVLAGSHKINIPLFIQDNTTASVVAGSTLKISNPMTLVGGTTLTKTGDGTLSIEAPVFNTAAATIVSAAGVTSVYMDMGSNTALQVTGGVTNLKTTQHLTSVDVSGGVVKVGPGTNVVAVTNSFSVSGSGQVDLQNGKMIVDYTGSSPLTAIKSAVDAGSLTSSLLTSGRAIGYGEASDLFAGPTGTFAGETVDASSVLIAYTINGDASLDGSVSSVDFNQLVANYGVLTGARWTQADFDGDNKVTTLDFNVLAGAFGQSLPPGASLGAVVPEPASFSLLVLAAGLMCRRK